MKDRARHRERINGAVRSGAPRFTSGARERQRENIMGVRQDSGPARSEDIDEAIRFAAERVLSEEPEAPVKVRLLRDVLQAPSSNADLRAAVSVLDEHPRVRVLAREQHTDGSWGRFHTADCSAKQKIGTTAMAVHRAVELGLPRDHPVLSRVRPYLEGILDGRIPFPDRAEKHENWPTGVALFTGAVLSRFAADAPALDGTWDFWSAVVRRSFRSGTYDLDAELEVHRELLGRSGKPGWMRLHSGPVLEILGSRSRRLPGDVQSAYVRWLWEDRPRGLVYHDVPLNSSPEGLRGHRLGGWLASLELLSAFRSSPRTAQPAIERLLASRNAEGLWDFGIHPSCARFSATYRRRRCCTHDWTVRVACLLKRFLS